MGAASPLELVVSLRSLGVFDDFLLRDIVAIERESRRSGKSGEPVRRVSSWQRRNSNWMGRVPMIASVRCCAPRS
jgi:hypothetical protein